MGNPTAVSQIIRDTVLEIMGSEEFRGKLKHLLADHDVQVITPLYDELITRMETLEDWSRSQEELGF